MGEVREGGEGGEGGRWGRGGREVGEVRVSNAYFMILLVNSWLAM